MLGIFYRRIHPAFNGECSGNRPQEIAKIAKITRCTLPKHVVEHRLHAAAICCSFLGPVAHDHNSQRLPHHFTGHFVFCFPVVVFSEVVRRRAFADVDKSAFAACLLCLLACSIKRNRANPEIGCKSKVCSALGQVKAATRYDFYRLTKTE